MAPSAAEAPPLAGIKYEKCTIKELKTFIRVRKVQIALEDPITKRFLIRHLKCNDREATFRFLDLPGELRNAVYEELLTFPVSALKCHPQILATCAQLNTEAKKILLYENQPRIRVNKVCTLAEPVISNRDSIFIKCGAYEKETAAARTYEGDLLKCVRWPAYLHRFAHVSIELSIAIENTTSDLSLTANAGSNHDVTASEYPIAAGWLYLLVSFLQESPSLESVTLAGNIYLHPSSSCPNFISRLLHPLTRAIANFDCDIVGFIELPEVPDHLRSLARTHASLYHENLGVMLRVANNSVRKVLDLYWKTAEVSGEGPLKNVANAFKVKMDDIIRRTPGPRVMGSALPKICSVDGEIEMRRTVVELGHWCDTIHDGVESMLPGLAAAGFAPEVVAVRSARRERLEVMPAS